MGSGCHPILRRPGKAPLRSTAGCEQTARPVVWEGAGAQSPASDPIVKMSFLFHLDLLTDHEPEIRKSLQIKRAIFRFMERIAAVFGGALDPPPSAP